MEKKSIIIIGAGMAGLSAGCYAQMNGYKTRIFEKHNIPGGLCTSWKRKGYLFDGCIHWLFGSRTGQFNKFFHELGALQNRQFIDHEEFIRIEGDEGKSLIIYANIDRLENHMKELAPEDTGLIEEFCNDIRIITRNEPSIQKPMELMGISDMMKMLKMLQWVKTMRKYSKISIQDFAAHFKNPFMRKVFPLAFEDIPNMTMFGLINTLADSHKKNAGMPLGGSLAFSRDIEKRYTDLGGEVAYKSRVNKILVENDQAAGVRLEDGTEYMADMVISACDGRTTLFDMLDGKYLNDNIRNYYDNWPIYEAFLQISLGINQDFSNEPHKIILPFKEPIKVGNKTRDWATVRHYCHDPSMAPPGKSVVTVSFMFLDYEYWKKLYEDREGYKADKKAVADAVIIQLDQRFPGIRDNIEIIDVATPVTYERYTGNWKGSYMGWLETPQTAGKYMKRSLPGLGNFYMAGQWIYMGGGVPGAVMSGRHLVQIICKQDKRKFTTTVP